MTTISKHQIYSKGSIISPEGSYEWEGKSDGDTGTITLTVDGTETKTIKFTKDELEDLFNQTTSRIALDKRLMMDFMGDDDSYVGPFKSIKTNKKNTRRGKTNKNNKNKNKKNNKKSRKSK